MKHGQKYRKETLIQCQRYSSHCIYVCFDLILVQLHATSAGLKALSSEMCSQGMEV